MAGAAPAHPDLLLSTVVYGTGGGRPLSMHLLRPAAPAAEPMPVLVRVPGGGYLVALLGTPGAGNATDLEGSGGWAAHSSLVQAVCDCV